MAELTRNYVRHVAPTGLRLQRGLLPSRLPNPRVRLRLEGVSRAASFDNTRVCHRPHGFSRSMPRVPTILGPSDAKIDAAQMIASCPHPDGGRYHRSLSRTARFFGFRTRISALATVLRHAALPREPHWRSFARNATAGPSAARTSRPAEAQHSPRDTSGGMRHESNRSRGALVTGFPTVSPRRPLRGTHEITRFQLRRTVSASCGTAGV